MLALSKEHCPWERTYTISARLDIEIVDGQSVNHVHHSYFVRIIGLESSDGSYRGVECPCCINIETNELTTRLGILIKREASGFWTKGGLRFYIWDSEFSVANVALNALACSHYHVTRSDALPILNEYILWICGACKSISPLHRAIIGIHPWEYKSWPDDSTGI